MFSLSRLESGMFPRSGCIAGPSNYARRHFSISTISSARTQGYYEALKLPRNATKQQVKAKFYEVSPIPT